MVRKTGIDATLPETAALKRVAPYRDEILTWLYRKIVNDCRQNDILPVWVFLPMVRAGAWQDETEGFVKIAEESGFIMINLQDIYRDESPESLRLAQWDEHPNTKGHQIIAARLYDELFKKDEILALGLAAQTTRPTQ
jgi:hypothetical protein